MLNFIISDLNFQVFNFAGYFVHFVYKYQLSKTLGWTSSVEATLFEHRRAVCLWGEKGSGKTALCLEFCRSLNQMSINLDHLMNLFKWSSKIIPNLFLQNFRPPYDKMENEHETTSKQKDSTRMDIAKSPRLWCLFWPSLSLFLMATIQEIHLLFSIFVSQIIFRVSVLSGTFRPSKTMKINPPWIVGEIIPQNGTPGFLIPTSCVYIYF